MEGSNWINGLNDADIIPKTASIVVALVKDPSLYQAVMSSIPTQEQLQESHERHQTSYNGLLGGDPDKALEHQKERRLLNRRFAAFATVVKLAAAEDPTLLARLGLTPPKPKRASVATLPRPENLKLHHGDYSCEIGLKCAPVKNAKSYDIGICEGDPSVEGNWRHAAVAPSATKMLVKGLTPGKVYWFRVRGIGAHGPGPWSQYASLMSM